MNHIFKNIEPSTRNNHTLRSYIKKSLKPTTNR